MDIWSPISPFFDTQRSLFDEMQDNLSVSNGSSHDSESRLQPGRVALTRRKASILLWKATIWRLIRKSCRHCRGAAALRAMPSRTARSAETRALLGNRKGLSLRADAKARHYFKKSRTTVAELQPPRGRKACVLGFSRPPNRSVKNKTFFPDFSARTFHLERGQPVSGRGVGITSKIHIMLPQGRFPSKACRRRHDLRFASRLLCHHAASAVKSSR